MLKLKECKPAHLNFLTANSVWHATWEDLSEDYQCGEFLITDDFGKLVPVNAAKQGFILQRHLYH